MTDRDSLREYANRNWQIAERDKATFFAPRRPSGAEENLRMAHLLWQHMKAIHPD